MSVATVVIGVALVAGGCAHGGAAVADVRRANAELKARVAALESEVADLKLQRTPLTVNGLTLGTLGPPPELKLTSTARPAEWGTSLGQGRITYIAGGGVGNLTITGTGTIEKGVPATITTTTTTKSAATSTTTTTTPAK